jgi:tRNA(Ile)-lysidine synthase
LLDPEALRQRLLRFSPVIGYCVAYSGGRDSHVLLHLMAALRGRLPVPVRAVHVDHGLQPAAADWAAHCRRVCDALEMPLTVLTVTCTADSRGSLEEAARAARYRAFGEILRDGEALLLAHHREDQAETVLLRLLRGAGVHGLAGMPSMRPLGRGWLLRPLLDVPRAALAQYAQAQSLRWVEDPSNRDDRFDRNFLRCRVLPLLAQHWPGYAAPLARAAEHAREAAELADALADLDLAHCAAGAGIDVEALRMLPEPRQRNLLRLWLRRRGLRPPGDARLRSGLRALTAAGPDRSPMLEWGNARLRRYRDRLLLEQGDAPCPLPPRAWDLAHSLDLSDGQLVVEPALGEGLRRDLRERRVEIRFRAGGERCRPVGRPHGQSLKKLLQEQGVPPWERGRLPLIYVDGALAAVADLWICHGFQAESGEPGLRPIWRRRVVHQGPFC